jgi:amidase
MLHHSGSASIVGLEKRIYVITRCVLTALLWISYFSGCSLLPGTSTAGSNDHVFIDYWPSRGKNARLRLAVKDNIDIKGAVTTAGSEYVAKTGTPATSDAECLTIARQKNVRIVGKTNMSEFAAAPSGINDYFGTPRNPLSKTDRLIPGGSSSGSAVAIANGSADVAFATDTAGSIRVPAACCGIVGLKTTFGLVSLKGVFPIEPKHLDTVGPMGKDIDHVVQGMDLLQNGFAAQYEAAVASRPSAGSIKIGRLYLSGSAQRVDKAIDLALTRTGFQVFPLDKSFTAEWDRAKNDGDIVAASGTWMSDRKYFNKPAGVSTRTKAILALGEFDYTTNYQSALDRRTAWQSALHLIFQNVDFIALPTLQNLPPKMPLVTRLGLGILEAQVLGSLQNTVAVNFAGNPALAIPVPIDDEAVPVTSLQLVGPLRSEARLLNAGRLIEARQPRPHRRVFPAYPSSLYSNSSL